MPLSVLEMALAVGLGDVLFVFIMYILIKKYMAEHAKNIIQECKEDRKPIKVHATCGPINVDFEV